MSNVRSPISWVGGKYRLAKKIITLFPEHTTYVEPFGGAAHVLFKKPPAKVEVYNDIYGGLVNFFRIVKDPSACEVLTQRLRDTLYSREVFGQCLINMDNQSLSDIDRAFSFAVVNRQSFGSMMETWGYDVTEGKQTLPFKNFHNLLNAACERLRLVQIEHSGFEYIL